MSTRATRVITPWKAYSKELGPKRRPPQNRRRSRDFDESTRNCFRALFVFVRWRPRECGCGTQEVHRRVETREWRVYGRSHGGSPISVGQETRKPCCVLR